MIQHADTKCQHLAIPFIKKSKPLSNAQKIFFTSFFLLFYDSISDQKYFLSLLYSFSSTVLITSISHYQSRYEGSTVNKQKRTGLQDTLYCRLLSSNIVCQKASFMPLFFPQRHSSLLNATCCPVGLEETFHQLQYHYRLHLVAIETLEQKLGFNPWNRLNFSFLQHYNFKRYRVFYWPIFFSIKTDSC